MKFVRIGDEALVQEDELAWCAAHPDQEIARHILQLNDRAVRGEIEADGAEFGDAVIALRRIRPRQAFRITEILTYLSFDPVKGTENFIVGGETLGLVPHLTALDRSHLLSLMPGVRAQQAKFMHPMRLVGFPFDRVIPDAKIPHLRSRNTASNPTAEIFAYVTRTPADDEVIVGIGSARVAPTMLMHQLADGVRMMHSVIRPLRERGQFIELRRFVRGSEIADAIFNPRISGGH